MEGKSEPEFVKIKKDDYLAFEELNKFFVLSGDLLCIAGFDGYFKRINPAVCSLLGYSEEELLSRPINDFVFEEDRNSTSKVREEIYQLKPLLNFENRYQTKDGRLVWLSWTSMPCKDENRVFAIAKDITEKKKEEEERLLLISQTMEINEQLKQFTRMTSHDIRSPVGNLLNIFNLIDVAKIQDQETLELLELLRVTSGHLHKTLESYIDIMVSRDRSAGDISEISISALLEDTLATLTGSILATGAKFIMDLSAFDLIVFSEVYFRSILLNLISNAIKYRHPDREPEIRISTRLAKGIKQFVISDNGLGFDLDLVGDRVFGLHEVFHDHPEGKGIGLYLVHAHVTALGGNIAIESEVHKGTTFILSFKDPLPGHS